MLPPVARADSLADILANLGNVGTNGLPRLSFDLVEHPLATELGRLGFAFKLSHQVVLAHGKKTVSEWRISGLRTAVYIDGHGDLTWLHPDGRMLKFPISEPGFSSGRDGSSVNVSPDGGMVEITMMRSAIWRYKNGFIESLEAGGRKYYFKTDRETILAISTGGASGGKPLLEINYSNTGFLSEMAFADGKKRLFQWTPDHCLQHIAGDAGPELAFDYDDRLLKSWRKNDGPLNELKWLPAETSFRLATGAPLVLLAEDSLYTYRWRHEGGVDILDVCRKFGARVSRTRLGSRGIVQETPYETLRFVYKTENRP